MELNCDNLEGWNRVGAVGFERERTCVYLWLMPVVIGEEPTQYCKTIILQLQTS